jgi:nucleoside-diphosphate kinase
VYQKTLILTEENVALVYQYCIGTDHYSDLEKFMTSGPVVFYVVKSECGEAIDILNNLVGSTDPKLSLRETIRGAYGTSVARNVIHSTQNGETFKKEVEHFLSKSEILDLFV